MTRKKDTKETMKQKQEMKQHIVCCFIQKITTWDFFVHGTQLRREREKVGRQNAQTMQKERMKKKYGILMSVCSWIQIKTNV